MKDYCLFDWHRLRLIAHRIYTARLDDNADAKKILTAFPAEDGKRPPGRPRITWARGIDPVRVRRSGPSQ